MLQPDYKSCIEIIQILPRNGNIWVGVWEKIGHDRNDPGEPDQSKNDPDKNQNMIAVKHRNNVLPPLRLLKYI